MCKNDVKIRIASVDDAEEILKIYSPYIEKTAVTFEYEIPDISEFRERIKNTLKRYPYLIAEADGRMAGYAYTGAFHPRAAYGWAAEVSVYLDENKRGMGIGRKLYNALEHISEMQNILNLNACIARPISPDEHLTTASIKFHEKMSYKMVGKFHKCGYKFNTWYDMVWMEKLIGGHCENPDPVIPFPQLSEQCSIYLESIQSDRG